MSGRTGIVLLAAGVILGGCSSVSQPQLKPAMVAVSVKDLPASVQWYRTHLGYTLRAEQAWPEHGVRTAILTREGFDLELIERAGSFPITKCIPTGDDDVLVNGYKKMAFATADLDGLYGRLKASGINFVYPDIRTTRLGERYFMVEDLEGNVLQFFDEESWRH